MGTARYRTSQECAVSTVERGHDVDNLPALRGLLGQFVGQGFWTRIEWIECHVFEHALRLVAHRKRISGEVVGIHALALSIMTKSRIAYFGPAGTFTEQALLSQGDLARLERVPFATVPDVLDAVERRETDYGFVPIENSIEGTVNFTQDALVFDHDLLIQREVVLDIEHCVVGQVGASLDGVRILHSIPVATAQCHHFIRTNMSRTEVRSANSTSDAARLASESKDSTVAALAPRGAAMHHGLAVLAENVADHQGNQTRFVLVGKDVVPAKTGHDKTGVVVFQRADEPGSLISILQEFAARRINLSNLLSRPTKRGGLGDYCFIMYADGHIEDELVADALRELHAKQGSVKFLGSYPAAGDHAHSAREHADARWREADDWVSELRSHISR